MVPVLPIDKTMENNSVMDQYNYQLSLPNAIPVTISFPKLEGHRSPSSGAEPQWYRDSVTHNAQAQRAIPWQQAETKAARDMALIFLYNFFFSYTYHSELK